jgi:hypothetical protein
MGMKKQKSHGEDCACLNCRRKRLLAKGVLNEDEFLAAVREGIIDAQVTID